jgi:endonuclease/exonuclease/phosphatase family metal-dependent hydrolase
MTNQDATIKLNILDWNLHAGVDWFGRFNPQELLACLKGFKPDLCGFQEVDRRWSARSRFWDLAEVLAGRLGMAAAFSPSLTRRGGGSYGNLILSRYPLTRCWAEPLADSKESRSLCGAQLIVAGVTLTFITTHLGLTVGDRCRQAEQIIRFGSQFATPMIITGDFNAGPTDRAVQILTGKWRDLQKSSTATLGGTFLDSNGQVGLRIDYILTTPDCSGEQLKVIPSYCSDHLPLLAKIRLRRWPGSVAGQPVFYQ